MFEQPLISALVAFLLALPLIWFMGILKSSGSLKSKHVFITGGSKGIGLALACAFLRRGCSVSIFARTEKDLKEAREELENLACSLDPVPKVNALCGDTGKQEDLTKAVHEAQESSGPIDILVCNAGLSIPGLFVDQTMEEFEKQMNVNYLGTVRTIQSVLPEMLTRRTGHLVLVSSMLGITGFAGYSSYAPTKWALRGLADCLHNELQGTGVRVSVAYPPDTQTPGYDRENESKPDLCHAVNKSLGSELFTAAAVAEKCVQGIQSKRYHLLTPDIGSNALIVMMTSLTPKALSVPIGFIIVPFLYVVSSIVGWIADRTARRFNSVYVGRENSA